LIEQTDLNHLVGLISLERRFPSEPPSQETLVGKLEAVTGIQVSATAFPVHDNIVDWEITFCSPSDRYSESVWCHRNANTLAVEKEADVLNRCPNYLLFVTTAAIEDLGGVAESHGGNQAKSLPNYARMTFAQWKEINRGTRPPVWKNCLAVAGACLYFLYLAVAMVAMVPVYLLIGSVLWWRIRQEDRSG